ncbi:hypothetical protein LSTR_LSTR013867 [Laodelphax striatellus]|uniref:Uncharacterized protein n=1 Tax=Laodelphax striatellus TaxID=195883 RepID=A0A482XH64_LAOST|nr:hypothetical protein LSTR_LSTR013867 [Laodelphax striatellus]
MSASWPCTEIRLNSINYNGNDLLVADRCFQISQAGQYSRFLMKLTIDPPSPGDPSTTNLLPPGFVIEPISSINLISALGDRRTHSFSFHPV